MEKVKIYQLEFFSISSKIIYVCSGSSNSTTKTSWIMACDSHQKILDSQPWSLPTRQISAAQWWAAAHRLRTAGLNSVSYTSSLIATVLYFERI